MNDIFLILFFDLLVDISIRIMKKEFKQWWSSVSPISTKRTITSYRKWIHWTLKRTRHLIFEILTWDKNMAGLIWLKGNQPSPLDTWIFNDNTYINKRWDIWTYSLPTKSAHNITKIKGNINYEGIIAGSMNAHSYLTTS